MAPSSHGHSNFYVCPDAKSRRRISMDDFTAHFHRAGFEQGVPYITRVEYDAAAETVMAEAPPHRPSRASESRSPATTTRDDKAFVTMRAVATAWCRCTCRLRIARR